MSDYISRESIIKWIDDSLEQCGSRYTAEQENMMEMFRTVVNDCLPFADVVKREHGGWEWHPYSADWACVCCDHHSMEHTNFCPNCGADMRGTDDV